MVHLPVEDDSVPFSAVLPTHQPHVAPLRREDIPTAFKTFSDGFADTPLVRYLRSNRPRTRKDVLKDRIALWFLFRVWIRRKIPLTVAAGLAFIVINPPSYASKPKNFGDHLAEWIGKIVLALYVFLSPVRYRERRERFEAKMEALVEAVLGSRVDHMISVDMLVTAPAYQGSGYGGALVESALSLADMTSQAVWLKSAYPPNERFYESHGFKSYGEVIISDDPSWEEPPVVVHVMVREPKRQQNEEQGAGVAA